MKFFTTFAMFAALFTAVGCTPIEKQPDSPKPKRVKTEKPTEEENVPASVSKLLPPEQLNADNAHAQTKAMFDQLDREKNQMEKTASAKRE